MKFYLSSYKIGNETDKLKALAPANKKAAYIPNALDYSTDLERRKESEENDMAQLKNVGLDVEQLDLRDYFGKKEDLKKKLDEFGVIWARGGNVFVLRQAMKLSGFDTILKELIDKKADMLYGGYSAGVCVLAPSLKGMDIVDDVNAKPYEDKETVWEGLNIIDYVIEPHYKSEHPESELVNKEIEYMIDNKILFKALRDGEVITIE